MKRYIVWYILFVGYTTQIFAQKADRDIFITAEFDLLASAYTRALPKFLQVLENYPENSNYNFRVGYCYYNIPDEKLKAIPYFEKATANTSDNYKEGVFKETNAPIDVYLYLGSLYKANNEMDKAKTAYGKYLELVDPKDEDKVDFANRMMTSLGTAEIMKGESIDLISTNLGGTINDERNNAYPAISGDMNTMAFTTLMEDGKKFMYVSTKDENGQWDKPKNITQTVGSVGDCFTSDLNHDGTKLLLIKQDPFKSDIYISQLENKRWSKMKKLTKLINTKYWETHASFSPDGKTIYFTSDYKKGFGGLDIYKSEADDNGWWQMPENLGNTVNSKYDEESPHLANDSILFFSSQGNENMGGFDVFYSAKTADGTWGEPVNVGYPINTSGDNTFYVPLGNKNFALYPAVDKNGFGGLDILEYEIFSEEHPHNINLIGKINVTDKNIFKTGSINVQVINQKTGMNMGNLLPDNEGVYTINLQPGDYNINISGTGIEPLSEFVHIPNGYEDPDFFLSSAGVIQEGTVELYIASETKETTSTTPVVASVNNVDTLTETLSYVEPKEENEKPSLIAHSKPLPEESKTISEISPTNFSTSTNISSLYTVQVCALKKHKAPETMPGIIGLKVLLCNDGLNRYVYGIYSSKSEAAEALKIVKESGYPSAYVINLDHFYKLEDSASVENLAQNKSDANTPRVYTIQFLALREYKKINYIKNLPGVSQTAKVRITMGDDGYYRYTLGTFYSKAEALNYLNSIKQNVNQEAFLRNISQIPSK